MAIAAIKPINKPVIIFLEPFLYKRTTNVVGSNKNAVIKPILEEHKKIATKKMMDINPIFMFKLDKCDNHFG